MAGTWPSSLQPGGLDRGAQRSLRLSRRLVTLVLPVLALMLIGCGSSSATTTESPATRAAASPTPSATASGVSGTWTGKYSGVYTGTFTLTWQQTGSNLSGTITLSAPPKTLQITGTVQGTAITFGAVGGVTYSGSISGSTMSGTYVSPAGNGSTATGSWSATKSP